MNIKYKILSVDPNEHSMVVRFYTDTLTEEMLATYKNADGSAVREEDGSIKNCRTDYNINVWQVPAPTGADLESFIMSHAPVYWFDLQEKIHNPEIDTSMDAISSLVGEEKTVAVTLPTTPVQPE